MTRRPKRNFSPESRLETAQLIVDRNYTVREAAEAMNVSHSTMDKWGHQLRQELGVQSPIATPMTPGQLKIRELDNTCAVRIPCDIVAIIAAVETEPLQLLSMGFSIRDLGMELAKHAG